MIDDWHIHQNGSILEFSIRKELPISFSNGRQYGNYRIISHAELPRMRYVIDEWRLDGKWLWKVINGYIIATELDWMMCNE
jgi:hypothetical protein